MLKPDAPGSPDCFSFSGRNRYCCAMPPSVDWCFSCIYSFGISTPIPN